MIEFRNLMAVHKCLMSGETNKPMMGIVFDGLSAAYLLTKSDTRVEEPLFMDAIQKCVRPRDYERFLEKCLSRGLAFKDSENNITFTGQALFSYSLPSGFWYEQGPVLIEDGLLIRGRIDKKHIGTVRNSIIQALYHDFDSRVTADFITNVTFILNEWFATIGFTVGISDCIPLEDPMKPYRDMIDRILSDDDKNELSLLIQGIPNTLRDLELDKATVADIEMQVRRVSFKPLDEESEEYDKWFSDMERLESLIDISHSAQIRRAVQEAKAKAISLEGYVPDVLEAERREGQVMEALDIAKQIGDKVSVENFPEEGPFNVMAKSGAKGSAVNTAQITSLIGQIVVMGKRIPLRMTGGTRSLPYFQPGSKDPKVRGFIQESFLAGMDMPSLMFAQMGGREGLIDTGTKTRETGDMQRSMVKALEGIKTEWDGTVRMQDQSIVQFLYGDDGFARRELEIVPTSEGAFPSIINIKRIVNMINTRLENGESL